MFQLIKRLWNYPQNTVLPWEIWEANKALKENKKRQKLNIGFCSIFPPFQNGVAAANYYFIRALIAYQQQHDDINLFLIPVKKKIDKRLFQYIPLQFAEIENPYLDVIVFFGLGAAFEIYSRKAKARKIVWQTMHGDAKETESERNIFNQTKKADQIIALTQWTYNCYRTEVKNVSYIPHGVDPSLFCPLEKETRNKKVFTCLFVSRIHYYKGIMPLLDAIPLVLKKEQNVFFKIIAPFDKNSPYLSEIMEKVRDLKNQYPENLHIDTRWTSYESIPLLYKEADVLIFPSNNEGFGLPLIEAMSSEVPCIVMDKKPMSEIVIDNKVGFCLPASKKEAYHGFAFPDPGDIAEKIIFLRQNEKIRKKMGKAGRNRVLQEYDISKCAAALVALSKEIVNKKE